MSTMDSSAFKDKRRKDGSGERDILFNGPGDRDRHGHVVERTDAAGNRTYPYVRDVEGNVYADENRRAPRPDRREAPSRDGRQQQREDTGNRDKR